MYRTESIIHQHLYWTIIKNSSGRKLVNLIFSNAQKGKKHGKISAKKAE